MTRSAGISRDLTSVLSALERLQDAPNRIVLLVGPPGSGKTRHLLALEATRGYRRVPLGGRVAEQLREIPPKRRPGRVREIVRQLFGTGTDRPVLVDNIEVLFLPELRTDPLALFRELSRNRTLLIAWPGTLDEDGTLHYAELGHPEHQTFRNPGVPCLRMPGTA